MFVFVKVGTNPTTIIRIELHQTDDVHENDHTWIKLAETTKSDPNDPDSEDILLIDPKTGEITLSDNSTKISFNEFVKGMRMYSVNPTTGVVSKVINSESVQQNTDVPMSFTRANTVVNLGRL